MSLEWITAAIRRDPHDDLARTALCDCLEENGEEERAELQRLIYKLSKASFGGPADWAESARATELLTKGVAPVLVKKTNEFGMTFVLVEPGSYMAGLRPEDEVDNWRCPTPTCYRYKPHVRERVARPFWLAETVLTRKQHSTVVARKTTKSNGSDCLPAAIAGSLRFKALLHLLYDNNLRLPTSVEWEYACRGGHVHCGQEIQSWPYHADTPTMGVPRGKANIGSSSVNDVYHFAPNRLGLYGMIGNVWEWCTSENDNAAYELRGGSYASVDGAYLAAVVIERDRTNQKSLSLTGLRLAQDA